MLRFTYLLFQGALLLISFDELLLFENGPNHYVSARIKSKHTCQYDVMKINCYSKVIKIYGAFYSRTDSNICTKGLNKADYCDPVDKTAEVRRLCSGKARCNISVDEETMSDHCPEVLTEYLNVMYQCHKPPLPAEPPDVSNKSTMVLTRPPTPFVILKQTTPEKSRVTTPDKTTERGKPPLTAEPPYVSNKSTMVLTRPPTPFVILKQTTPRKSRVTTPDKTSERGEDSALTEELGSEGGVSNEVVHYVLFGTACIHTNSAIFAVLLIFVGITL